MLTELKNMSSFQVAYIGLKATPEQQYKLCEL